MLDKEKQDGIRLKITNKKVVVFSKSYCPYCKKAKSILQKNGVKKEDVDVMELDKMEDGAEIQEFLSEVLKKGRKVSVTVPQIFICGEAIGGCSDLEALERSGKLTAKLQKA